MLFLILNFKGTLSISDGGVNQPFKGKERRVFLFEQSVIIAECIPPRKEYGNPTYNFKNQIMVCSKYFPYAYYFYF
jgi:hypothetical protein